MAKKPFIHRVSKQKPQTRAAGSHPTVALSVRQPVAELILQGIKKFEYRTMRTHKRERVYLYAAKKQFDDPAMWKKTGREPGDLPTELIVGTVEIVGCFGKAGKYSWKLANPKRLKTPRKPTGHPQPVFFIPF